MWSFKWCMGLLLFAGFATSEIKNKGWWKNTVFYQVYPRSFMDSDNDGTGDLKGITSQLSHFKDAGIGAVWLSPIYASPMVDNGYDISDFRAINPMFGTMADLESLVSEAKKIKIKIILDLVPNHTSDQHKWFTDKETKYNYYVWKEGKADDKPPNNWLSVFGNSAWTREGKNSWYFHQFYDKQPDLNYSNIQVQKEMEDVIKFWLDKGIDGFRIDAVPHLYESDQFQDEPKSGSATAKENEYDYLNHIYTKDDPRTYMLVRRWRQVLDVYADEKDEDEKVILTEAYTSMNKTIEYYEYGSHVPFNFNFIISANNKSQPDDFKKIIDEWVFETPSNQVANWVMGNHDRTRTATRYPGRADQMTMLAMILPGIAVTYNGEEIGMEDNPDATCKPINEEKAEPAAPCDFRDPARTPFQWNDSENAGFSKAQKTWLPVHKNYKTLNLATQKNPATITSHYKLYQKLTDLRSKSDALKNGKLQTEVLNDGKVLAVVRDHSDKKKNVMLLINFSDDEAQSVDIKNYSSPDHYDTNVYISSIGSNIGWNSTVTGLKVTLPAKTSVVVQTVVGKPGKGAGSKTSDAAKTIIVTSLLMLIKFM